MKWLLAIGLLFFLPTPASGVAINADIGLTPAKDQTILRSQVRYQRKSDDPTNQNRDERVWEFPQTIVYGFTESVAGILTVPYLDKELRTVSGTERIIREDSGVGDISVLAKYLAYRQDFPGATSRLSLIGGMELPTGQSGDSDAQGKLPRTLQLGSGSWDPIVGAAYTRQTLDDEWDLNATYQFNTASNQFEFGDLLKYTVAYQKRVWPWQLPERGVYTQLNLVLEANGVWAQKNRSGGSLVDNSGGNTIFLSPGLQAASQFAVVEISAQLPTLQTLNGNQVETDFVWVSSIRVTF
ncbi:MAG: transporter [Candidatus Omnitrophica bacterium]|nr:transporter [Candidatus Omnitrophota bacterium]